MRRPVGPRTWASLALLAVVLLFAAPFGLDRLAHRGQVLRGVSVAGVSVAGLDRAGVERTVTDLDTRLTRAQATVRVAGKPFPIEPVELGYSIDVAATADAALSAGREGHGLAQLGWWLGRWLETEDLLPVASVDPVRFAQVMARLERDAVHDGPFEGAILPRGGSLAADYPRAGRGIDRARAERAVLQVLGREARHPLDLPLRTVTPKRTRAIVDAALGQARELVGAAVVLTAVEPGAPAGSADEPRVEQLVELALSPAELAGALRSRLAQDDDLALELTFDAQAIEQPLARIRSKLEAPPRDARFEVDAHDKLRIVPSRIGTVLDARKVAAAALEAARTPLRRGELPLERGAEPALSTEQAEALHIRGPVAKFTTHHPCCRPRVQNIHRIAEMVDGTVVRPGEILSLNELVGPRTPKKGFVPAPTIEEGEMVDSTGGGISQFATTLFSAVLRGGYDVLERTPHSFYFDRYPMGWDATLSYPKPDLVLRNNTEAGLLIKTEHTATSITVKLYGDVGGCKVQFRKSRISNVVKPPVEYTGNPEIDPEDEKVHYGGMPGWTVTMTRIRTCPDGTTKPESRKVTYQPRPREVEVHPCRIPQRDVGYTGEDCPDGGVGSPSPSGAPQRDGGASAEDLVPPGLLRDDDEP